LETSPVGKYSLIAFSSALHHFVDYVYVVALAADKLRRPGFLAILHEPLPDTLKTESSLSWVLWKIDRLVWKYMGKVIMRPKRLVNPDRQIRRLADFHSRKGIDIQALRLAIAERNGTILRYCERNENMRHWWSAWLGNFFPIKKDGFHLLARFD